MLKLDLSRFWGGNNKATIGTLAIGGEVQCFTLEDMKQEVKVPGETRIPPGVYRIKLRTVGRLHEKYRDRYTFHAGMLWLQDVPDFEWIYLHTGNVEEDTRGCPLVGQGATLSGRGAVHDSRSAYTALYPGVSKAILAGTEVYIGVSNH